MGFMTERTLQIPPQAPERLVRDIETYSALIELQAKMAAVSPWYERLA